MDKPDKTILEENEYLQKLEKIIRRDYYPDLDRIYKLQQPVGEEDEEEEEPQMTLRQFFNTYKSEDTESFNQILNQDHKKHQKQYWWLFQSQKEYHTKQLALEDQNKNKLGNMIEGLENKQLVFNKHEIENNFYFNPKHLKAIKSELDQQNDIMITNTRLGHSIFDEPITQTILKKSKQTNVINELSTPALLGIRQQKEEEIDYLDPEKEQQEDQNVEVNGYQMLVIPSPSPSDFGSPLMTFGQIVSSPLLLDKTDQKEQQIYHVPKQSSKEIKQSKLIEKINSKNKEKEQKQQKQIQQLLGNSILKVPQFKLNQFSQSSQKILRSIQHSSKRSIIGSLTPNVNKSVKYQQKASDYIFDKNKRWE